MYTKNIFAAGAVISAVAAVPMAQWHKRDLVWVTETDVAVVTQPVTTTVWVNPGETVPTEASSSDATLSHFGHHHHSSPAASSAPAPSAPAPSAPAPSAPAPSAPAPASSEASSTSSVYVAPSSTSAYVAPAPTSTSVYVAPTPSSTSVYVAPTTSSVYVAPTTSSVWVAPTTSTSSPSTTQASPAEASCTNSNSGSSISGAGAAGTSYSGDLTYYAPGLGACGCTSAEGDHIVAIAESLFDQYMPSSGNPNMNPLCGRQVSITGKDGSAYTATIVDRCTGCKEADLDLTESFFNTVTNNGDGRVHNMAWSIIN